MPRYRAPIAAYRARVAAAQIEATLAAAPAAAPAALQAIMPLANDSSLVLALAMRRAPA